ncbi:Hypothetical protein SMAX5B_009385 [Scophthalmus maximus]|uniref:Uncharacterized protein n=1 Tax=Scophthalmus maximus TaxID=52904 RepID=A0A2U9C836_SCOMX|nr:Hypothetical protein SMAX5B_009385 [Scophthalmus maximus]
MISLGRCTEEPIIEKKTVHIGDDVNLTCIRRSGCHGSPYISNPSRTICVSPVFTAL